MSGLFSALSTSSAALQVFSKALGVSQENVANSATAGYAARRIRITDGSSGTVSSADRVSITTASDGYSDAIVRHSSSGSGEADSQVQVLNSLNQLLDITGNTGVLAAFQGFSKAFSQLSVSPDDVTLRANAINAGGQAASAFQSLASSLDDQQRQVDGQINQTVATVNSLAGQISNLNTGIRAGQQNDANLRQALDDLSKLVDINVTSNSDGTVSVLAGGQVQLVGQDRSYPISALGASGTTSGGGLGQVTIQTTTGQTSPTFSGTLGGLLNIRNNVLPGILGGNGQAGTLNSLAVVFGGRVNSILSAAQTSSATGATLGSPLFSFDTVDPTNAARSFRSLNLTPAELGVATVAGAVPGSANGAALALSGLSTSSAPADQVNGVSLETLFSQVASGIGQRQNTQSTSLQQAKNQLAAAQTNRQDRIGVSLDQEAISVVAFQRAYQASAQIISTLNQLTQDEINIIK